MKTNLFNIISMLAVLSMILSACSPASSGKTAQSNQRREARPSAPQGDVQAVVDGDNTFAFDLYHSLRSQDGNLILSPFSISLALAMPYAGARGETESQMAQTLHFTLPQSRLHPAFNALDLTLEQKPANSKKDQEPMQLSIANAVWAEQTYPFLPDFLDTLSLNYGAGIRLADFINQSEAVRKEVNGWVEDQTKNKIKNLVPEGVFNPDTRMALVNAIYFKADWLDQFDANSTGDYPFHLLDGSEIKVPTMNQDFHNAPYSKGDGWQMVELPYAGGTAAMDILVPDAGRFDEIDSSLDFETVSAMLGGLQPTSVALALPKFKFESQFGLSDQLSALGMTDAFDRDLADFSGMTGQKDLFISAILHKAFVAVDEKGTEAAAATIVIMQLAGAAMMEVNLTIDRPFVFFIRDLQSGQILFVGRVLNPAQ